jgi:hypothetical protein
MNKLRNELENLDVEELSEMLGLFYLGLDYEQYAAQCLQVPPEEGGSLVPFILNQPQKILHGIIMKLKNEGRLLRLWVLKSRRQGISTYVSGYAYQQTAFVSNRYTFQVTNRPTTSDFLFRMIKRFHANTPKNVRPKTRANNARMLEFNNDDGTGLDSAFRIATAGVEEIGTGQAIHILHLSEIGFYGENAGTILNNAFPSVPKTDPESMIIGESTANGVGGEFYTRFWGARYRYWISRLDDEGKPVVVESINYDAPESNQEVSVFLPWFIHTKNVWPVPKDFIMTEEELLIKTMYNLSDEQISWRRWSITNEFKGSIPDYNAAHPDTPENAFIATGTPYFDNGKVLAAKKSAPPPKARYEYNVATGQWEVDKEGRLFVWEEPKAGKSYVIGADVAEGLVDGDNNDATILDHRTGDEVASWNGKCALNEWGDILMAIGKRYNTAYLGIERNNAGIAVVNRVFDAGYPRQHMEMVEEPPNKPRRRFGWHTNEKTRPMILDNLKTEVAHGTHGIRCAEAFGEMLVFQRTKQGRYEAQPGCKDDRILSRAIAKHLRNVVPIPLAPPPSHHKVGITINNSNGGGWGGVGHEGKG